MITSKQGIYINKISKIQKYVCGTNPNKFTFLSRFFRGTRQL